MSEGGDLALLVHKRALELGFVVWAAARTQSVISCGNVPFSAVKDGRESRGSHRGHPGTGRPTAQGAVTGSDGFSALCLRVWVVGRFLGSPAAAEFCCDEGFKFFPAFHRIRIFAS